MSEPAEPPLVSPDGRFWWDGAQWVPLQGATAVAPQRRDIADGVASGLFKFLLILAAPFAAVIMFITLTAIVTSGSWGALVVVLPLAVAVGYFGYRLWRKGRTRPAS